MPYAFVENATEALAEVRYGGGMVIICRQGRDPAGYKIRLWLRARTDTFRGTIAAHRASDTGVW